MLPEPADLAMDAGALAGVNVLLWLLSLPLGKVWPVDFIWSCWPPVQCVPLLLRPPPALVLLWLKGLSSHSPHLKPLQPPLLSGLSNTRKGPRV